MDVVGCAANEDVVVNAVLRAHPSQDGRVGGGGFELRNQKVQRFAGRIVHGQNAAGGPAQATHENLRAVDLEQIKLWAAGDGIDRRVEVGKLGRAGRNVSQKLEIL